MRAWIAAARPTASSHQFSTVQPANCCSYHQFSQEPGAEELYELVLEFLRLFQRLETPLRDSVLGTSVPTPLVSNNTVPS
jgi:hypothetical protein